MQTGPHNNSICVLKQRPIEQKNRLYATRVPCYTSYVSAHSTNPMAPYSSSALARCPCDMGGGLRAAGLGPKVLSPTLLHSLHQRGDGASPHALYPRSRLQRGSHHRARHAKPACFRLSLFRDRGGERSLYRCHRLHSGATGQGGPSAACVSRGSFANGVARQKPCPSCGQRPSERRVAALHRCRCRVCPSNAS